MEDKVKSLIEDLREQLMEDDTLTVSTIIDLLEGLLYGEE